MKKEQNCTEKLYTTFLLVCYVGDPRGGGYMGTECIPTAKQPPGAEVVNVKI